MRINKYISSTGFCSRRAAEQLIQDGHVTVNGKLAQISTPVEEGDVVCVDGKRVEPMKDYVYLILNKPMGITCTTEHHIEGNIIDYINYPKRLFPIGRLDKDSTGLIVLTNDGDIVNQTLREENGHTKEYEVEVDGRINEEFLTKMAAGVKIYNPVSNSYVITKQCEIHQLGPKRFKIVLTQGYNRQIRRMCSALNYHVRSLCRVRFLNLTLKGLKVGQWRECSAEEIAELKRLANKC